jgi:P pilus assembly chaperone PapD
MRFITMVAAIALLSPISVPAIAGPGDLLIAPTRVVLNSSRGTEVILNNIGKDTATYRISLEVRRMDSDGSIDLVEPGNATELENKALAMISYAPRRVVLPPQQPQAIRIGVRAPADLPDGEYRVHMLFRAIPDAKPVTTTSVSNSVSVQVTPIYGITIPVIVRRGALQATAAISGVALTNTKDGQRLDLQLTRSGTRSTYGNIRVMKPGEPKPLMEVVGIGVYPEVTSRTVSLGIAPDVAALMKGPVVIQYVEEPESGGKVIAEIKTTF